MNATAPTILIIEDEDPIRKFLRVALSAQNYRLVEAASGRDGLVQAASAQPDVIILDLGLPDIDGVELTRQLREWCKVPILIVSARGREQDKVTALDAGADDYLTKPFGVGELLARLRVALRHAATPDAGDPVIRTGGLVIDLPRRQITLDGALVHVTPNEYRVLSLLARHLGKVITHKQLLKEIWGPNSAPDTHYLRVYVNQLRQKIETDAAQPQYLLTETGVGYRLAEIAPPA